LIDIHLFRNTPFQVNLALIDARDRKAGARLYFILLTGAFAGIRRKRFFIL
jgi:hypothetical protein